MSTAPALMSRPTRAPVLTSSSTKKPPAEESNGASEAAAPATQCYHRNGSNVEAALETHPPSFCHRHCSSTSHRTSGPLPHQFVVEKQGRFNEDAWNTRVFTLDSTHHRLYISKAEKATELFYRCMVRVDTVKVWPTYNSLRIGECVQSDEAKRTVCIKGIVGVKPSAFSFLTRLFGSSAKMVPSTYLAGRPVSSTKEEKRIVRQDETTTSQTASAATSSAHRDRDLQPAPSGRYKKAGGSAVLTGYGEFITEVWMVRTMTTADLHLLARALRRAVPDTCVLTGFHRAGDSSHPPATDV
ncbi:hypothetical protein ABB37_09121 [Leptomonas pyrrhocoris]|uniref:Uncharacterized protein n=1 Tax=Leptomonas pyrrhocoris TaxID=157538 RepID=A0A0N0VD64_LEPPY|nr:hypothetical protein ABB37_09121 [Leptomonas pyrrhocoris]XP_015652863.1 hypothetical protein ABB37_09121 [Leptomonas pyrrhocoris]KPA74423.1 hypothetical protein ABB37_09121 [Leptomonas pyrrhocoris]KPA74424.1 hypothetical protein ABB37_09121 [Leptomonas pyrrhocoris]|eukprot:XP_015652862.1 hypothetical protein ABB37_09121 [Leptomonas pyrrhocoris]